MFDSVCEAPAGLSLYPDLMRCSFSTSSGCLPSMFVHGKKSAAFSLGSLVATAGGCRPLALVEGSRTGVGEGFGSCGRDWPGAVKVKD